MSQLGLLVRAVVEKQLILLRRYWINTITLLVTMYVFFAMIFYGGQAVAGPAIEESLDGIVVGFFLFTATTSAYFGVAGNVMREAQWGTLEQLFMSPFGIGRVMAVKSVYNVAFSVIVGLALLGCMLVTTGRTLRLDVLTVVPLSVLAILPVVGIGFVFAGLSLLYKRIENVTQLVQFAFVALIAVSPTDGREYLLALPLSQGSDMLREAMTDGTRLWEFPLADVTILVVVGLAYLSVGYAAFHWLVYRARKLGVLGHY
ncbi:ABC transporter permease [Natribaculum luteum]|uniref:ABC transporter permease n=1 Tax=Natribaculum luteum TaxID=1586232 RepID=A0ABD5NXH2_9EURY|nr:ABC transporter permease [Natribaculum luteum]